MNLISKIQLRAKIVKNYLDKIASMVIRDPFFKNVVLLLHGNGDNTGQNNAFIDNSTNNFTITRNGNVAQGTFSPYGDNWSNYFDGTGDRLKFPDSADWDFGTGDFTIEFWFALNVVPTTDATTRQSFVSHWQGTSPAIGFNCQLGEAPDNKINFGWGDTALAVSAARTWSTNRWYHYAVARSGTSLKLFIDGEQVASVTDSTNMTGSTNSCTIGALNLAFPTGENFIQHVNGYVSNVRILKGTALYTAAFIPPTAPLTAITNTVLLTCQSNRFKDNSSSNRTATRDGDVTVTRFSPFELTTAYLPTTTSQSVYFDGTGDYLRVSYTSAFDLSSGDFTIEGWFNSNSFAAPFNVIAKDTAGTNFDWAILITNNTTIIWYTAGTAQNLTATVPAMSVGTWYHVAYVRSSGVNRIYLNGISYAENTMSITNASQVAVTIGCNGQNSPQNFINGYISNLRIVKGTAVYTSNFTPSKVPLVSIANTSLLTCQSDRFVDASPNNFTITPNGNAAIQLFNPFFATSQLGIFGGSGYFDGSGDDVSFPTSTAFEFGTGDFTVEAWLYPNSIVAGNTAFCLDSSSFPRIMWIHNDGAFRVYASATGSSWSVTHSPVLVNKQWNHLVFQRDGNNFRTFLNGSLVATTTTAITMPAQRSVGYVGRGDQTSQRWDGLIADVRLVKGTAVYNTSGFTPPTAPLTAVTNTSLLLNFQNAEIIDNAMMNNLETVGNAQISTSVNKYGTGSLYFDGNGDYLQIPNNQAFSFGTGDFTIEAWVYIAGNSAPDTDGARRAGIFSAYPTSGTLTEAYLLDILGSAFTTGTGLSFGNFQSGVFSGVQVSTNVAQNTWHHIAVARSGTTTRLFLNGSQIGSGVLSNQTVNCGNPVKIGRAGYTGYISDFNGYIDDLRITKGVARYTADFTPPTDQFPDL